MSRSFGGLFGMAAALPLSCRSPGGQAAARSSVEESNAKSSVLDLLDFLLCKVWNTDKADTTLQVGSTLGTCPRCISIAPYWLLRHPRSNKACRERALSKSSQCSCAPLW